MPETQTKEKIETLKSMGAELKLVPAKPYKDPDNYVKLSSRIADNLLKEAWPCLNSLKFVVK